MDEAPETFRAAQVTRVPGDKIVIALFDGPGVAVGLFACSPAAAFSLAAKTLANLTEAEKS